MAKKKDGISVVVTLHAEGIITHKTMRNIFSMLQFFNNRGIDNEIVLHLDNPTSETENYVERYRNSDNISIYTNSFGDPSKARNFAISKAKNDIIAVLDGDDIISKEWMIRGYDILVKEEKNQILHVEYDISFGALDEPARLWRMSNSRSLDEDTLILMTRNRWSAGYITRKSILKECRYKRATRGFGYEDWVFNCDTRNAGIEHNVVPKTVKYYRIKSNSVYKQHTGSNTVTDYTELFSTDNMRRIAKAINSDEIDKISSVQLSYKRRAIACVYRAMKELPYIRNIVISREQHIRLRQNNIEEWLMDDWCEANQFDDDIYPSKDRIMNMVQYSSEQDYLGKLYCKLISYLRKNPDYLFLPPQLNIGGTEKVIVNYINAFAKLHPDWHIAVLSSIPEKNPYNIPDNVDFINFYEETEKLDAYDLDYILSKLVIQTGVKRLHVIHNEFIYKWIEGHEKIFREGGYSIYSSQFMDEYNENEKLEIGFTDPFIQNCYSTIDKIFTDNSVMRKRMIEKHAFDEKKVMVHYQPMDINIREYNRRKNAEKTNILWASRLSPQKRPDILKKIAKKLDPSKYHIDVYGRIQPPYNAEYFNDIKDIATYKGTFNGIESLDISNYDLFLYTSQTDGLPNILLEISALGLPIVASNVGGVSDIVNEKTGFLVDMNDIDGYIEKIDYVSSNDCGKYVKNAQELVRKRHSFKKFYESVENDIE